jgi:hypothetical protein
MRAILSLCITVLLVLSAAAQQASAPGGSHPDETKTRSSDVKRDVDPQKRNEQRAFDLLRQASAQASTFDGPMRPTVLFFIGQAYAKKDPKLSKEAILSAYEASKEFDPHQVGTQRIRMEIMSAAQKLAPEKVEQGLLEDPQLRDSVIEGAIDRKLKDKDYEGAIERLRAMTTEPRLSQAAQKIMAALPPDAGMERNTVFASVVTRYQSGAVQDFTGGVFDSSELLRQYWKQVRPQLVDEMITELLRQAEDSDADSDRPRIQVTAFINGQGLAFDTKYKLRLFQLIPVLRKIDPSRAERLLRDNPVLQPAFKQFPDGISGDDVESVSYTMSIAPRPGTSATIDHVAERIVADATKHPNDAIATAQQMRSIPERIVTLLDIAEACLTTCETAAKTATDYAVDAADDTDAEMWPLSMPRAARIYLKLKDLKAAEKALEKGAASARRLYDEDSNAEDPNLALKLYWPSTMMWQEVVVEQEKVSPQLALTTIKEISDPEIQALARVWVASSILGVDVRHYSNPMHGFKGYSVQR